MISSWGRVSFRVLATRHPQTTRCNRAETAPWSPWTVEGLQPNRGFLMGTKCIQQCKNRSQAINSRQGKAIQAKIWTSLNSRTITSWYLGSITMSTSTSRCPYLNQAHIRTILRFWLLLKVKAARIQTLLSNIICLAILNSLIPFPCPWFNQPMLINKEILKSTAKPSYHQEWVIGGSLPMEVLEAAITQLVYWIMWFLRQLLIIKRMSRSKTKVSWARFLGRPSVGPAITSYLPIPRNNKEMQTQQTHLACSLLHQWWRTQPSRLSTTQRAWTEWRPTLITSNILHPW